MFPILRSFNPRTRVGCDRSWPSGFPHGHSFNPRTRVGCDPKFDKKNIDVTMVSIHAPAWGATIDHKAAAPWSQFQSTHPRGVRHGRCHLLAGRFSGFNPRTRLGCDLAGRYGHQHPQGSFNPRTRVGCDDPLKADDVWSEAFQSTHPRGVRHAFGKPKRRLAKFQSTHPRGVRHELQTLTARAKRFQSTHPRGVRQRQHRCRSIRLDVSIHAPAWGATPSRCARKNQLQRFQSTHPRGVRPQPSPEAQKLELEFQSTHPRGVRPREKSESSSMIPVSIHAPAWGATFRS